ncbi:hypothetical protein FA15DRAFT_653936 [Coprinopsis marcescibilis]|uniref:LYC1 C-terminal domain-containing protein n=1 Tax=Coprinopsis marcescibilis TaxID=230819 RepID=A0A5C3L3G8_COPMA|nr:hypothetical protein FA15DRAFT_653936 [Coprinopsis marcescibilis]
MILRLHIGIMLSLLSLFSATPQQTLESRRRAFPEWGKEMTLQVYLDRDSATERSTAGANGRFATWSARENDRVLAPRDNPTTLNFPCSCETFRREVIIVQPKSSKIERGVGYGIASVYTQPENRGKGHAKHMMRLLHWVLAKAESLPLDFPQEWGLPPARPEAFSDSSVSVLYSDIGEHFYSSCGFLPGSDHQDGWSVARKCSTIFLVTQLAETANLLEERWEWLEGKELKTLWDMDSEIIEKEMEAKVQVQAEAMQPAFTFLPREGLAEFQTLRAGYFAQRLALEPVHYGIRLRDEVPGTGLDGLVYASWTLDLQASTTKKLVVTRLRVPPSLFGELVSVLGRFCKRYGIDRVEFWNLTESLVTASDGMGGTTADMKDHLPSMKWYGAERSRDVEWVNNEK